MSGAKNKHFAFWSPSNAYVFRIVMRFLSTYNTIDLAKTQPGNLQKTKKNVVTKMKVQVVTVNPVQESSKLFFKI